MIAVPITKRGTDTFDLVLIFDDTNVKRLQEHDPGELDVSKLTAPFSSMRLGKIVFAYENPAGMQKVLQLLRGGFVNDALKFVFRGWKDRPELGDDDEPYLDITNAPS